jgi:hypothetical protein
MATAPCRRSSPSTISMMKISYEIFGPEVHFKRIWIEMTDDPVTRGIEKKLLWWDNPGPWLKQNQFGNYVDTRTGFHVSKSQFKKG